MGSGEMIEFLSDVAMVLPNTPLAERAIALKAKLTTTLEPAGETVRVGIYRDVNGWHRVLGKQGHEPQSDVWGDPKVGEADVPLPRIPTVAARVVEEKS